MMDQDRIVNVVHTEKTMAAYRLILDKQITGLWRAMELTEFDRALEICHKIKGSAALFGYADLGEACREAEGISPTLDPSGFKSRIGRVFAASAPASLG